MKKIESEKEILHKIKSENLSITYYPMTDEIVWAFLKIPYNELKGIIEKIESIKNRGE